MVKLKKLKVIMPYVHLTACLLLYRKNVSNIVYDTVQKYEDVQDLFANDCYKVH